MSEKIVEGSNSSEPLWLCTSTFSFCLCLPQYIFLACYAQVH